MWGIGVTATTQRESIFVATAFRWLPEATTTARRGGL
jgi:hypothetical protein